MASINRLDPYGDSNPAFRRAYIRERLAANKTERDALAAERNEINHRLRSSAAKGGDGPAAMPLGTRPEPVSPDPQTPSLGTRGAPSATAPSLAAHDPPETSIPSAKGPAVAPYEPKPESPPKPKKKTSIWRRKRS